jgi:hypothetical protein
MTTSSNNTGERLNSAVGFIKVPDGLSGHPLSSLVDGDPVDTGTSMIHASNLNHLAYESVQHIVMDWRSGDLSTLLNGETPYPRGGGYGYPVDVSPPSVDNVRAWNKISWALDNGADGSLFDAAGTARAYHFIMVFDALNDTELVGRWIRCFVRAKSAATGSLQVACCVTPWGATPLNQENIWSPADPLTELWHTVSTTEETITIDLRHVVNLVPDLPRASFRCEETGPNPITVNVIAATLWLGWYSTNTSDYWRSFSAYELREGT